MEVKALAAGCRSLPLTYVSAKPVATFRYPSASSCASSSLATRCVQGPNSRALRWRSRTSRIGSRIISPFSTTSATDSASSSAAQAEKNAFVDVHLEEEEAELDWEEEEEEAQAEAEAFGEVDLILASRVLDRATQYLILWKDDHPDSWEPADNIAKDVVDEYEKPWWQAARKADVDRLKELLDDEELQRDVNAVDENERTALFFSAGLGSERCVRLLVEYGADVHWQDRDGFTALHIASGYVHVNTVKALVELGADPNLEDAKGRSALSLAQELLDNTPKANPLQFARRLALDQVVVMEGESGLNSASDAELDKVQAIQEATTLQDKVNASSNLIQRLTITCPDDWHLHVRDGDVLSSVVPHSASTFHRAIIMPNLKPPVKTVAAARAYRERILSVLPSNSDFEPLMTLYLTDSTTRDEIKLAKKSGVIVGVKLYPAGATTNSQAGVTDLFGKCMPVLQEMAEQGLPLLVHGEVADQDVDIFDRERFFIETVLSPLVESIPHLKIVMEHITTQDAVEFIKSRPNGLLAATVTPQHLLLNRNAMFKGGLQPHHYCLPVLKQEKHRQALVSAVTSGSKQYFLGTDSAPHERHTKETSCGCAGIYSAPIALPLYAQVFDQVGALDKLEAFASFNGPLFYGLPVNRTTVTLEKVPWKIPTEYKFGSGTVVPICAGETLQWSLTHQ